MGDLVYLKISDPFPRNVEGVITGIMSEEPPVYKIEVLSEAKFFDDTF